MASSGAIRTKGAPNVARESSAAPAQIEKGIASLGAILKQELERAPEPVLV